MRFLAYEIFSTRLHLHPQQAYVDDVYELEGCVLSAFQTFAWRERSPQCAFEVLLGIIVVQESAGCGHALRIMRTAARGNPPRSNPWRCSSEDNVMASTAKDLACRADGTLSE